MEIKLCKNICKWWIFQSSYFGLLECFSCGAWFTKSRKFDHVWIRQTTYSDLMVSCLPFLCKKKQLLFIPFCQATSFRRNSKISSRTHRCRRLQMKVSHWRCLKWVSCQLFRCCFEAEVWPPCWLRWCIMISSFNSFAFVEYIQAPRIWSFGPNSSDNDSWRWHVCHNSSVEWPCNFSKISLRMNT